MSRAIGHFWCKAGKNCQAIAIFLLLQSCSSSAISPLEVGRHLNHPAYCLDIGDVSPFGAAHAETTQ